MKQKACELKDRNVALPTDAQLLRRIIELQNLREQVRLAEVAMKTKTDTTINRHH
jgi:hypothetical protein